MKVTFAPTSTNQHELGQGKLKELGSALIHFFKTYRISMPSAHLRLAGFITTLERVYENKTLPVIERYRVEIVGWEEEWTVGELTIDYGH